MNKALHYFLFVFDILFTILLNLFDLNVLIIFFFHVAAFQPEKQKRYLLYFLLLYFRKRKSDKEWSVT